MKLQLLVARAGAGFAQNRGDVIEVPEAEALRMISAGQAVAVEDQPRAPVAERAVRKAAAVEKAAK